jgi:hypothetical protein
MLSNMDELKILNFIQYRHVLQLLFKGFEAYQPGFHKLEKLNLYEEFTQTLDESDKQIKHQHLENLEEQVQLNIK